MLPGDGERLEMGQAVQQWTISAVRLSGTSDGAVQFFE